MAELTLVGPEEQWTIVARLVTPYAVSTLFQLKKPSLLSRCGRVAALGVEGNRFEFRPPLESVADPPTTFVVDGEPYVIPQERSKAEALKKQWQTAKQRLIKEIQVRSAMDTESTSTAPLTSAPAPHVAAPAPSPTTAADEPEATVATCTKCGRTDVPIANLQIHQLRCRPPAQPTARPTAAVQPTAAAQPTARPAPAVHATHETVNRIPDMASDRRYEDPKTISALSLGRRQHNEPPRKSHELMRSALDDERSLALVEALQRQYDQEQRDADMAAELYRQAVREHEESDERLAQQQHDDSDSEAQEQHHGSRLMGERPRHGLTDEEYARQLQDGIDEQYRGRGTRLMGNRHPGEAYAQPRQDHLGERHRGRGAGEGPRHGLTDEEYARQLQHRMDNGVFDDDEDLARQLQDRYDGQQRGRGAQGNRHPGEAYAQPRQDRGNDRQGTRLMGEGPRHGLTDEELARQLQAELDREERRRY